MHAIELVNSNKTTEFIISVTKTKKQTLVKTWKIYMVNAQNELESDVLVIGSGIAGLTLSLTLAQQFNVTLLSKGNLSGGSSLYAQGGIAAVLTDSDSFSSHINDTLNAGAGLCDANVVRFCVEQGPDAIKQLVQIGVNFTLSDPNQPEQGYHLTREGGHSHRRVIHADDATGYAVESTLVDKINRHSRIQCYEQHIAIDLITSHKLNKNHHSQNNRCLGAYVYDRQSEQVKAFKARFIVLATGGASKVYLYTSNPDTSTGDGIAMAWRAGCRIANMEFNQFHPTCLYHPDAKAFLISEAVRGEGGILRLKDGSRFMQKYDSRSELAPRDIVARAIDHEMKRSGSDCVYLDISHKSADFIKKHFPNIHAKCLEFGYDMTQQAIPVVPAAHYTCGGILTDLNAATDIEGLYAIGEAACTQLHGANRMASNSILECLVFANTCAQHIIKQDQHINMPEQLPAWDESRVTDSDEEVVVSHNWDELRRFMWDYVGIVRTTKRLQRAKHRIDLLSQEIEEYYGNFRVSNDLIELRNLVVVADLIVLSALSRHESRGLHFTLDYPKTDDSKAAKATILCPNGKQT